jgi:hypothetical protein
LLDFKILGSDIVTMAICYNCLLQFTYKQVDIEVGKLHNQGNVAQLYSRKLGCKVCVITYQPVQEASVSPWKQCFKLFYYKKGLMTPITTI